MIAGTLAWIAGVVAPQLLSQLPALHWLWLAPLAVAGLPAGSPWLRLPAIAVLGALWTLADAHLALHATFPEHMEKVNLSVVGTVKGLPESGDGRLRFLFRPDRLEYQGTEITGPDLVRLSWYGNPPDIGTGERWRLTVRLKAPRGFSNPGGFDYEGWLYRNGIGATGYVRNHPDNRRIDAEASSPSIDALRADLVRRQSAALPDARFAGLIRSLTLGDRGAVQTEQWRVLRRTGTSHLLAISGLHIGMFAGLAFFFTRLFWSGIPALTHRLAAVRAAACAALLAACGYAALAGFSLPTQRALMMVAVFMGGIVLRRTQRPLRGIALALLVVSAFDPKAALSPGFWLSFGAVAVILAATVGRRDQRRRWRWLTIQGAIAVGLAPLLILFFGQVSLIAPLANLVAIPWIGFAVLPAALLGTFSVTLSQIVGGVLLTFAEWATEVLWQVLVHLNDLPFAAWHVPESPWWLVAIALVGVALVMAPRGLPMRSMGVLLMAPMVWYPGESGPRPGAFRVTLLDVGQGLSVVVRTHGHTLVYDTGPRFSDRFDTGGSVVVPYLRSRGVGRIDRLVLSHGDNDHSGGAASVRRLIPVADERRSPMAGEHITRTHCQAGQQWRWDGVRFTVLHPQDVYDEVSEENNHSCVLHVKTGRYGLLLPGDIEREAEADLVARYGDALRADILVVPHHGSTTSSTQLFLDSVRPRIALVGSGYKNRWSFPRDSVRARYRETDTLLMSTADWGAIEITVDPVGGITPPAAWRVRSRRYWHAAFGGGTKSSNIAPSTNSAVIAKP